jgi:hypothetical protein
VSGATGNSGTAAVAVQCLERLRGLIDHSHVKVARRLHREAACGAFCLVHGRENWPVPCGSVYCGSPEPMLLPENVAAA